MLSEDTSRSSAGPSSGGKVLEPDTFWLLIEKLLLRSSVEAHSRHQHNLALSALCRGHALPRLPKHLKGTKPEDPKVEELRNTSKLLHREFPHGENSKLIRKQSSLAMGSYCQDDETNGTPRASTQTRTVQNATKAKSECFVNDQDVVYVSDAKIPPSERLWRYAMKHSRQKPEADSDIKQNDKQSARSNEAIYLALKQRLDEVSSEQSKRRITQKKKVKKPPKAMKICKKLYNSVARNEKKVSRMKEANSKYPSLSREMTARRLDQIETFQKQGVSKSIHNKHSRDNNGDTSSKQNQIESRRALYDCILKKRLRCGNKLETLNKEILNEKHNPRALMNRETTRKYAELKNDYLSLCYQECNLRHQIAILHAEIYMMQNKNFHKIPASIKTINLDSTSANINPNLINNELDSRSSSNDSLNSLLFPPLKAPKPLQKQLEVKSKEHSQNWKNCDPGVVQQTSPFNEQSDTPLPFIMDGFPVHGVCSIYSLSPQLAPPPKRAPVMTIQAKLSQDKSMTKLSHRLPKLSTVNSLQVADKTQM